LREILPHAFHVSREFCGEVLLFCGIGLQIVELVAFVFQVGEEFKAVLNEC
jgi:hypothetical protein